MTTKENSIGSRIKAARKAAHLTQEQLSKRIGMSRYSITSIENDLQAPTVNTLKLISAALGVPMEQLLSTNVFMDSSPQNEAQETDTPTPTSKRLDLIAGLIWELSQECQSKQAFVDAMHDIVEIAFEKEHKP